MSRTRSGPSSCDEADLAIGIIEMGVARLEMKHCWCRWNDRDVLLACSLSGSTESDSAEQLADMEADMEADSEKGVVAAEEVEAAPMAPPG
jgi:hypothetical protein